MSDAIGVAIIASIPAILTLVGGGMAWIVRLVQSQSKATLDAKDAEINALKAQLVLAKSGKGDHT